MTIAPNNSERERKQTKSVKRSKKRDYLNRIEMKKNEAMKMFIENEGCQTFFCKRTNKTEVKTQSFLIFSIEAIQFK